LEERGSLDDACFKGGEGSPKAQGTKNILQGKHHSFGEKEKKRRGGENPNRGSQYSWGED